jgi:hypothetical protein
MRPQTKPFVVEIRKSASGKKLDAKPLQDPGVTASARLWADANRLFAKAPPAPEHHAEPVHAASDHAAASPEAAVMSQDVMSTTPAPRIFHVDNYEDPVQTLLKAAQSRLGRPKKAADPDTVAARDRNPPKRTQPKAKESFVARNDGWDDLRRLWSR